MAGSGHLLRYTLNVGGTVRHEETNLNARRCRPGMKGPEKEADL